MNTCPLSENSMIRRVDCLRRYARQRKKSDVFKLKKQTDRDRIHVQISAGYSLMVYFLFTFWLGRSNFFRLESGVIMGWVVPCGVILFFSWLFYWTFKLRWACKVFDVYGVEMVSDIETRIAEQAVSSDGHEPANSAPSSDTAAPADAH